MRASTDADSIVLVFARAPVAGRAKTRLAPRLGAPGAARLQWRLTVRAVQTARSAFPVELHGTERHRLFLTLGVPLRRQKGADLGARMHHALAVALRRHRAAILIGSDCPALAPRDLRRAARLLRTHDIVLAPAEDGGYALVAMRKARAGVFEGIRWGGDTVLRDTLARVERAGLRCALLRTVWDVDRPGDLDRLRSLRSSSGARRAARR